MNREEAIIILSESKRQSEAIRDNPSKFYSPANAAAGIKNMEEHIAALELAIADLRTMQEHEKG